MSCTGSKITQHVHAISAMSQRCEPRRCRIADAVPACTVVCMQQGITSPCCNSWGHYSCALLQCVTNSKLNADIGLCKVKQVEAGLTSSDSSSGSSFFSSFASSPAPPASAAAPPPPPPPADEIDPPPPTQKSHLSGLPPRYHHRLYAQTDCTLRHCVCTFS